MLSLSILVLRVLSVVYVFFGFLFSSFLFFYLGVHQTMYIHLNSGIFLFAVAIFLSCLLMSRYPPSFLMYRSVSQSDAKEDALKEEVVKNQSEGLPPFVPALAD